MNKPKNRTQKSGSSSRFQKPENGTRRERPNKKEAFEKREPRERNNSRPDNRRVEGRTEGRTEARKPFAESTATTSSSVIFGVSPVWEVLRAGAKRVDKILVADGAHERRLSEILQLAKDNRIPFQKIPRANLSRFVEEGANHQGVIAFVAAADYANANALFEEIAGKDNAFAVILDGVEDPRNLGAILRTVDCAGADGVFIPERRAVGLTETVAKTSAGATEYVKIAKVVNISRLIDDFKERNVWTVGTSADATMDYTEWDWTQKSALVLGGEGKGLHRLVAEKCDVLVKIPLLGKIESLNVSVAAGIILYEARRQRRLRDATKSTEEA